MKDTLKQDLQALTIEGNTAYLPKEPLNDYPALKKILSKATGVYKKNTFVFPTPAQPIIDKLLGGTVVDFKKEFQFFATPEDLASYCADQIIWEKDNIKVLEPSAGHGALIDTLTKNKPEGITLEIYAVELSDLNFNVLKEKYGDKVKLYHADFMTWEAPCKFDIILANPLFNKNQDIDHIKRMYDMLDYNGQLIFIASTNWTFGQQKKQKAFKTWLEDEINGEWFTLEQGSFKTRQL